MLTIMTPPSVEKVARTSTGLASALRISVARLNRRLRAERDPDNELLPVGQLSVLGSLFRHGPQTVGELAALERVQPPSMTRTVNCLTEGGYVERRKHETDRRQVVVALAQRGEETLATDRRRKDAWLAQRLRELTPDERELLRKAAPIIERLAHA
jgi:DNA-binding MarR family transcriptional regulator